MCNLEVDTDPELAPTFSKSVHWLNNYFDDKEIDLRVASKYMCSKQTWPPRWYRFEYNHLNACYLASGKFVIKCGPYYRVHEFDVPDNHTATDIMQRLMVIGVRYNKADRFRQ